MRALAILAALAVLLLALRDAHAAPDEPVAPAQETVRIESDDHRVAIDLPESWRPERSDEKAAVISLRLQVPPAGATAYLSVFHVPGFLDPRAQAYVERASQPKRYVTDVRGDVGLEPLPHLTMDIPKPGTLTLHAWIYRVIDRNGFTVTVYCDPATWPAMKDACFRAAQSLTSRIPEWPARPEGYRVVERDGYEYLVQASVKDADLVPLHTALMEQEKRYAKAHGPIPKPSWNRPQVVVSSERWAARTLSGGLARPDDEFYTDVASGRLLAVPLRKGDAGARAELADCASALFHAQCYGRTAVWLCDGERQLAFAESLAGKPLPAVPEAILAGMPRTLVPFEELARRPPANAWDQAVPYVALFRGGPKTYRDALAAYLQDLAATGDEEAALAKRLLCLPQQKLAEAALAFVRDLKPVKLK